MNDVLRLAWECSLLLVCGSTLLLGLGCVAVAACRSPVHRQRLAELTVGGILIWLVLTLVPLPRLAAPWFSPADDAPAEISSPPLTAPIGELVPVESEATADLLPQIDPFASIPPPQTSGEGILPNESLGLLPHVDQGGDRGTAGLGSPSYGPIETPVDDPAWIDVPSIVAIVVGIYLAGAAICVALLLVGHAVLLWIRATGKQPPAWLDADYQTLAGKAHVPAAELLVSQRCSRPISWGLLRPAIVLPRRICHEVNRRLVGTILLHELGHVARRDAWGNFLFCLATPLLYCHPLYWWLRREWSLAAELVADDWAAWQTGKDAYVEGLMDLARTSPASAFPFVGATAVFSSPSQFYRRMQMLLAREQPLSTRTSVVWQVSAIFVAVLGIALASSLGGIRPVIAQDEPPAVEAPPAPEPPEAPPAPKPPALDPTAPEQPPRPELPARDPFGPIAPGTVQPPGLPLPAVREEGPPPALPDPLPRNATVEKPHSPEAVIQELRAEQAQLAARLQALQARLKELGVDPAITADATGTVARLPVNAKGLIELTRVDQDGTLWSEVWTADKKGQPGKLMSRTATGKLPGKGTTEPATGGKTETELVDNQDGTITVRVFDRATGKVIETRREERGSKPGKSRSNGLPSRPPSSDPASEAPTPKLGIAPPLAAPEGAPYIGPSNPAIPATVTVPTTTTRVPERASASVGSRELDLVSLATSYADAVSNVETAQARLAEIEAVDAKAPGTIPKSELTSARLAIASAQRKEQLLQRIAKVALQGVSKELDHAVELHKAGVIPANGVEEIQTRTEILKQILSTQPGNAGTSGAPSSNQLEGGNPLQRK